MQIECSVWNSGKDGWGLRVLGGLRVRNDYFHRAYSSVQVELDGAIFDFNIDKKSFWTASCGELIGIALKKWIASHGLVPGDRVWLEILRPYRTFKALPA